MEQEPTTLVRVMRSEYWDAVSKALCLAIQHLDSAIEQEKSSADPAFMRKKAVIEGLERDRETIRAALLAVVDDKTNYNFP